MNKVKSNQLETDPKIPLKQLNFKVSEDFYWKLKNFATTKRCKMVDVLERAFNFYQNQEKIINEINTYRQTIPRIEQQMQPLQGNMSLLELRLKTNDLTPEFFNKIGLTTTYQVLKGSLEECLRIGKGLSS